MDRMRILVTLLFLPALAAGLCWNMGENPFSGVPKVRRLDSVRVRIDWADVFSSKPDCKSVDFLIKSHPRFQPSQYKLSDFTLKGQRDAVLKVDIGGDYVFQIIAREHKGPPHGIDYKYSKMVTSYATDFNSGAELHANRQPIPAVPATRRPETTTTQRTYLKPQVKSLVETVGEDYYEYELDYEDEHEGVELSVNNFIEQPLPYQPINPVRPSPKPSSSSASSSAGLGQCIPMLRDNVGHGSNMKNDRLIINFLRFMNQQPTRQIGRFLETKRSCAADGKKKGYVGECNGRQVCCSTPWPQCGSGESNSCFSDFGVCDGRCFPREWRADGWPDCLDGSDEPELSAMPGKLHCVECAGVVLSSGFLCSSSGRGLTAECVEGMMGKGDCNVCVKDYIKFEQ